jgi:predicted 3-demethylubiquinone-9 3-methyltransferase (glyoxalase superfamily)
VAQPVRHGRAADSPNLLISPCSLASRTGRIFAEKDPGWINEKERKHMRKIIPCLWFDNQAEEAVNFYLSLFKNSKLRSLTRYGEQGAKISRRPKGTVMAVTFELDGQEFMALNGGPMFKFSPAISFIVNCETQQEIDRLWEKLSEGGEEGQCGWLKDKYGVSWQIVPTTLGEMLQDRDPKKSEGVMKALLQMKKIDIKGLGQAREQQ